MKRLKRNECGLSLEPEFYFMKKPTTVDRIKELETRIKELDARLGAIEIHTMKLGTGNGVPPRKPQSLI